MISNKDVFPHEIEFDTNAFAYPWLEKAVTRR